MDTANVTRTDQVSAYVPVEAMDEDGGRALAIAAFRRASNRVLREDSLRETSVPENRVAVAMDDVGDWEYATAENGLPVTGWITAWEGQTDDPITDQDAVVLDNGYPTHVLPDRGPCFDLPEHITAQGGSVRIKHGLNQPVTIYAYSLDRERVNYLFAQELTDNEAHVELLPGASHLTVTPDRLIPKT